MLTIIAVDPFTRFCICFTIAIGFILAALVVLAIKSPTGKKKTIKEVKLDSNEDFYISDRLQNRFWKEPLTVNKN